VVVDSLLGIFTLTDVLDLIIITVVVLALNLMAGYAGIPNFGMAVFVFIGAFILAGVGTRIALLIASYVDPGFIDTLGREHAFIALKYNGSLRDLVLYGVAGDPVVNRIATPRLEAIISQDLILSIILLIIVFGLAIIVGALTGIIASFAATRLKEDYLAIALLAFSEMMVTVVFDQTDSLAGGPNGAWVVRPWPNVLENAIKPITPTGVSSDLVIALIVGLLTLLLCILYAERIANSPMGRMLRAMRDDDLAISVYGRDVALTRLKVMAVGAAIASIAGAIYATIHSPVKAIDYNRFDWTFTPWAMMILGGVANNWGVILGAITIYTGKRLIHFYMPGLLTTLTPILEIVSRFAVPLVLVTILVILLLVTLRPRAKSNTMKRLITYTIIGLGGSIVLVIILSISIKAILDNIDIVRAITLNIFVGLIILLVLYLKPQGIIPEKPSKTLSKKELEEIQTKSYKEKAPNPDKTTLDTQSKEV
jgi:branched-chain amino acid transport system permease protein